MRIDRQLSSRFGSRTKAAEAIERGLVLVNGHTVRPSFEAGEADMITFVEAEESYVSNGGYKLAKALKDFALDVGGKIFADVGASNGGFTDCLFKNGAAKVYCIDVGENQLDASLLDKNIVIIDNFNARDLTRELFCEELDGVVMDVSFISLTLVLGPVADVLSDGRYIIALIKPQFECGGGRVGKRGVVKEPRVRREAIKKIYDFALGVGLAPEALTCAPVREGKNREYLIKLVKGGRAPELKNLLAAVDV